MFVLNYTNRLTNNINFSLQTNFQSGCTVTLSLFRCFPISHNNKAIIN